MMIGLFRVFSILCVAISSLAFATAATPAAEAMRASGSDYVMPVTFPVLEIRLSEPHHQLCAWVIEGEGRKRRLVFDSTYYATKLPRSAVYHARLDRVPSRLVLAPVGKAAPPVRIDAIAIVTADGKRYAPSRAEALAGTTDAQQAIEADGKSATLASAVSADWEKREHLEAGIAVAFEPQRIPQWQRTEQPGPPVRVGIYWSPYSIPIASWRAVFPRTRGPGTGCWRSAIA